MKILVISLLRMGDVVMCTPTLKGLRQRYPGAQIHLLMNGQFRGLCPLIAHVDRFHYFERKWIQESLGVVGRPIFEAYDAVEDLVETLNEEKYDRVLNLTQNRLSGWLCSLVDCPEKTGMTFTPQGQVSFGSPWLRFLNDRSPAQDQFHFSDVFAYAAGLSPSQEGIFLEPTARGEALADQVLRETKSFVVVQALTSDAKKNWTMEGWQECIRLFCASHPELKVIFLGAPDEVERLSPLVQALKDRRCAVELVVGDLELAYSLVRRSRLVLTLDTGIKHLAAGACVPLIELSVGSSDHRQTGVYKDRAVILRSKEPCAPCPHSTPCSRERHACAEALPAEAVALVMAEILQNSYSQLQVIQREFHDNLDIYLTRLSETGFWFPVPVDRRLEAWLVDKLVDRCSWKLLLQREHLKPFGTFGEEGRHLRNFLIETVPGPAGRDWRVALNQLETDAVGMEQKLHRLSHLVRKVVVGGQASLVDDDVTSEIEKLMPDIGQSQGLVQLLTSSTLHLGHLRRVQNLVEDAFNLNQIKLRIIRSMKTHMTETL